MTKENVQSLYWMQDKGWYEYSDDVTDNAFGVRLTQNAPPIARDSFALWLVGADEDEEI
ncbi:MAG: hypothetical protein LBN05_00370 [Oscillospiraceae bacterium]|nr:hypothetical protein [Oscillospiraceae bacterium]